MSYRNLLLDHTLIAIPYVAAEEVETIDELLQGTEEEIERAYVAVSTMHCKLSDVLFYIAHTKRWLHDGKGLIASKLASPDFYFFLYLLMLMKQRWWCRN